MLRLSVRPSSPGTLSADPALRRVFDSDVPAVVVFPVSHAVGLSVIRTLEDEGVPILAVDFKPASAGLRSRRATPLLLPGLYDDEETFVQGMLEIGRQFKHRPVLFCVDDEDLFLSLNRQEEFEAVYRLPLSPWSVVRDIVDKGRFYRKLAQAGFPVPRTVHASGAEELAAQAADIPFPCILKPTYSTAFRQAFDVKARRFDSLEPLIAFAREVEARGIAFIVQEFIPGGTERLLTFAACSDDSGRCLAWFTGRKVHQFPPDFGTCRLGESIRHPELERLGKRMLEILGYRGISLTEFKIDQQGAIKAIELNPRPGDWPERLSQVSGSNLVLAAYRQALGLPVEPHGITRFGLKWANLSEDLYYCVRGYKLLGWPHEHRGLGGWLRDLRGLRTGAFFSFTDPMPGLVRTMGMLRDFTRREKELRRKA